MNVRLVVLILALSSVLPVRYALQKQDEAMQIAQQSAGIRSKRLQIDGVTQRAIHVMASDTRIDAQTAPRPLQTSVTLLLERVSAAASNDLVSIARWDLLGVNGATQLVALDSTAERTPSGLWKSTLHVQGRYISLLRLMQFAKATNVGAAAITEMSVHGNDFDMHIDVFGTCTGCDDAVR